MGWQAVKLLQCRFTDDIMEKITETNQYGLADRYTRNDRTLNERSHIQISHSSETEPTSVGMFEIASREDKPIGRYRFDGCFYKRRCRNA